MTKRIFALLLCLTLGIGLVSALGEGTAIWQAGDTGAEVGKIQQRLVKLNYLAQVTGTYDRETEAAVLEFQEWNGLLKTGMVDPITWEALFAESARAKVVYQPTEAWYADVEEALVEYEIAEEPVYAYEAYAPTATAMPNMASGYAKNTRFEPFNTNEYRMIREQGFTAVATNPFSTFQADVDTSSYSQIRADILAGRKVNPDSVRIEEMLNYFNFNYTRPRSGEPFGVTMEIAPCPWNAQTALLQIGLQAESVMAENRPAHNLVFLIDTSGSMDGEDRLDLVKRAFLLLLDSLDPEDTVSIVTYASMDTVVLEGVPARERSRIMEAIEGLVPYGSTNGTAGLTRAYEVAERHFIRGGVNRILMATDGDLNTGRATSEGDLARLVMEKKQNGVTLTMLGFGYGNRKDNKMEALADYGDGQYYFIDTIYEARRALVTSAGGTFITVARDVKLQVDFNPAYVQAYRLIGYEHKMLETADFANDSVDGGDIGSGHRVTALYEIVPVGSEFSVDGPTSKYAAAAPADANGEWLTVNIRAKKPDSDVSDLYTYPLTVGDLLARPMTDNLRFAAAVAEVGMLLRDSEYKGTATYDSAITLLRDCGDFVLGDSLKEEFLYLVGLMGR